MKEKSKLDMILSSDTTRAKIQKVLGKNANLESFRVSLLSIVNSNEMLRKCTPTSVLESALMASSLDLPINNNLGFAHIVPYGGVAQLQIGYKGFIQLAIRSGLYSTISCSEIYEGQVVSQDPLKGFEFNFNYKVSDKVVGYAAYFKLLSGFEKTIYMSVEDAHKHGKEYSKTYDNPYGRWKKNFCAMAKKTVIKSLLSKYAPLSIVMQNAITVDQSQVVDSETMDVSYVDNGDNPVIHVDDNESKNIKVEEKDSNHIEKRLLVAISKALVKKDKDKLSELKKHLIPSVEPQFNEAWAQLA